MNLHITKEQFEVMVPLAAEKYLIGSRFYGHDHEDSDMDILYIYDEQQLDVGVLRSYGILSNLQLQYKDVENKIDHVFTSRPQFWANLFSGDSQVNLEVAILQIEYNPSYFRSFKVLRGLLGVAKRDWKASSADINRLKHSQKMLYIAKQIYYREAVSVDAINNIFSKSAERLQAEKLSLSQEIATFRDLFAKDLDEAKLFSYSPEFIDHLNKVSVNDPTSLIINNLNTINFKYD